jgi:hypothetical protein
MSELFEHAAASGELDWQDEHMPDAAFIRLMDSSPMLPTPRSRGCGS